ncbi:MBL fold metallo-hydrolase RNA specificity domain-containing protein [Rhodoferax sp. BAB1]|uniref:MBL fold metallo-hydrolase RNA specificity domain-containing protein n=1 Tax=Rhodoferax sp. BAB1 TaxID=2741720 RepID=UPI001576E5CA|nr:MBL fold metallo-hydrolase [Rhodoferax sp. BAB1]QKO20888.1 MBL fold metallo-hydrolase [Rhodoferax sp. BAB1]
MKLTFLGAAGTVTGSKYLLEHAGRQILVDCGLFQGYKHLREMNWEPFPVDVSRLDCVILTHAHLDHSGALPLLLRNGYRGPIYTTPGTIDLCHLLLPDSARLQEEEAEYLNRHQASKHKPALPLYTEQDARHVLRYMQAVPFNETIEMVPDMQLSLRPAGHIIGAANAEIQAGGLTIVFSGDVGRDDDPIMRPPTPLGTADYLVIESTYGDRLHQPEDNEALLAEIIQRTAGRGGSVVVPAFAVGRAQTLLFLLSRLKARHAIPDLPVFLDSPMAIDMTEIYHRHRKEHRLSPEECKGLCRVATMVRTSDESRALNNVRYPAVIISASGMATGGRVLHHLKRMAPDRRNTIVLVGYQAGGTRGARLAAGEKSIRIFGEDVAVNAEVAMLRGMSAHADAGQLMRWMAAMPHAPRKVFLTHGEPGPADILRQRVDRELGWTAGVPRLGQTVELVP